MVHFLDIFGEAAQKDKHMIDNLINCNCIAMTKMIDIVLPGMVEKKKGIIINNCAGAGRSPLPLATIYSATKAYVDFFSRFILFDINYLSIFLSIFV